MGTTNLLAGLRSKFAALSGELEDIDSRIERLRTEYAKIGEMKARAETLKEGIRNVSAVIRLIDIAWDEASVKPRKPHSRKIPLKPGESARWTLEILRDATEPMCARDIAIQILARAGLTEPDQDMLQRASNTVTACLRKHEGKIVQGDTQWPKRWSIIRSA